MQKNTLEQNMDQLVELIEALWVLERAVNDPRLPRDQRRKQTMLLRKTNKRYKHLSFIVNLQIRQQTDKHVWLF